MLLGQTLRVTIRAKRLKLSSHDRYLIMGIYIQGTVINFYRS